MRLPSYLLLCLLCWTGAIAQPAYLLHKPYAAKYNYLDSLWHIVANIPKADAAAQLSTLERWAHENGDNELAIQYHILTIKRDALIDPDGGLDSKAAEMIEVIIEAKKIKNEYLEADALQLHANFLSIERKYGQAFENFLEAYNIYLKFSPVEFPPKQEYLYAMGNTYYRYGDYDNALKYLKEAIRNNSGNELFVKSIYNALGMCYRMQQKYDSSEAYFRDVYNEAIRKNDTVWIGIAGGNIGIDYFHEHRYDEAIPLIEKDIELSIATKNLKNAAGSMNILAQIYMENKKYNDAEQLLKRALAICENKTFWPDYPLAEQLYTQLYKVYYAKNDSHNAMLYADSALTAKDSIASQFNALTLTKAKEKIEFVQHKLEEEQLANQKNIQTLTRNGLIVAILLLMAIGLLFINRQRLKQKELTVKKINAENDLIAAQKQLGMFRQSVQEKNNIIEQFTNEIAQMKTGTDQEIDNEILLKLERSTILTDEQWEDFRVLFEKVHKGFFKRVKDKMPDLTPGEIRFVTLSKLKLSPKEMSSILGISSSTIRNYRLRLRRKLGLNEDGSIEEIADAI